MGLSCPVHHYEREPPNTWPLSLYDNLLGTRAESIQWGEELGTELWTQQTPPFKARAHLLMSDLCIT